MTTDSRTEQLGLVRALFARHDPSEDGKAAFRAKYPTAPEEMITSAAYHIYLSGIDAALAFLVRAEQFLRTPERKEAAIDYPITFELLYHVYNWHQFQELLPDSRQDVLDLVKDIKRFVAEDDREALLAAAQELEDRFEATRSNPDFEYP